MNDTSRRIYVASLSDYNAGELRGRWVDATRGADHVHAEIADVLRESRHVPAEEWAIHDHEGFEGVSLGEWSSIEQVVRLAELLDEHGPVFGGLVNHFGGLSHGLDDAQAAMEQDYCGEHASLSDFAEQLIDECHGGVLKQLPELVRYHIDYGGIANDMCYGGEVFTIETDGSVHVFWSR